MLCQRQKMRPVCPVSVLSSIVSFNVYLSGLHNFKIQDKNRRTVVRYLHYVRHSHKSKQL